MGDPDRYRTQQDARRGTAVGAAATPYGEAINRHLGAVAHGSDEPHRPVFLVG